MSDRSYHKGTVPCRTWRMLQAMEEDQYLKRPAVPGRRPPIVLPEALRKKVPVVVEAAPAAPAAAPTAPVAPVVPKKESPFDLRLAGRKAELERLYRTLFQGDLAAWDKLLTLLEEGYGARPAALKQLDERRASDPRWYARRELLAMDVDPATFAGCPEAMAERLDYLTECGVNFLFVSGCAREALAALAQPCRERDILLCVNLCAGELTHPAADSFHSWVEKLLDRANGGADALCLRGLRHLSADMVRLVRLICELVCPGMLLAGQAGAQFFGAQDKPLCHLLCREENDTLWHTLATGDASLLRHETDLACGQPKEQVWLNRLRGENGLGWALDYGWLMEHTGATQDGHRQYLTDFFTGKFPGSDCRAELCKEGRVCGTTASLCGVEAADYERDHTKLDQAIARDQLLHAWLLTQSGLPVLRSGDEIGQLNDYAFRQDSANGDDARNLFRGPFPWDQAETRKNGDSRQAKQFHGLRRLEQLRASEPAFDPRADVWTFDTGNPHVLGLGRWYEGRKLVALFNFSGQFVAASSPESGAFEELVYGGHYDQLSHVELYPYGFVWLLQH